MNEIRLENIHKSFDGKRVLAGFQAAFPAGQATCIMGSSGCGKTTLLNILLGLLPPDEGRVLGMPERVGAVFQEDRLCEDFSPLSNIRLVTGRRVPRAVILEHLKALGLEDWALAPVRTLSGGMKRRVAIARAVLYGGDVLVLDEAFKGLDEKTKAITMEYVRENTRGKTLIAVTHDGEEAAFWGGAPIKMEALP